MVHLCIFTECQGTDKKDHRKCPGSKIQKPNDGQARVGGMSACNCSCHTNPKFFRKEKSRRGKTIPTKDLAKYLRRKAKEKEKN